MGGSPKAPDNSAQIDKLKAEEEAAKQKAIEAQQELTEEEKRKSRRTKGRSSLIATSETGLGTGGTLG